MALSVVVLAAGKGTRMKSDLPKVLCRVVDRPMIHFVLDALEEAGFALEACLPRWGIWSLRAATEVEPGNP